MHLPNKKNCTLVDLGQALQVDRVGAAGCGLVDTSLMQHCCPLCVIGGELKKLLGDSISHDVEIGVVGLLQHGTGGPAGHRPWHQ